MSGTFRFSIKVMGMLASCGVAILIAVKITLSLIQQTEIYRASRDAEVIARLLGGLSQAVLPLTFERSLSQVLLTLEAPVPVRFRAMLDEQRKLNAEAFERLDALAARSALPAAAQFSGVTAAIRAELGTLRSEIDQNLSRPVASRASEGRALGERMIALIDRAMDAGGLLRDRRLLDAARIAELDTYQARAAIIREYSGRNRTQFAIAALHKRPIDPAVQNWMHENNGRVLQSWQFVLAGKATMPANVQAAIEELRKAYFVDYAATSATMQKAINTGNYPLDFDAYFTASSAALSGAEKMVHILNEEMAQAAVASQRSSWMELASDAALSLAVAFSIAFLIWLLVMRTAGRINHLNVMMRRLAEGDVTINLDQIRANDEIGDMADAVDVFRSNAMQLEEARRQERSREIEEAAKRAREMDTVADRFAASVGGIVDEVAAASQLLEVAANSLSANAGTTDTRSTEVGTVMGSAMRNVEFVASAVEQLGQSVQEIRLQAEQTSSTAVKADAETAATAASFEGLKEATLKIGSIVAMISEIAARTNLLALNATIEAARAGDAGRGFAVVAQEVKLLADQTSRATREISGQIDGIQSATATNLDAIGSIRGTIADMNRIAAAVVAAVNQQSGMILDITENMAQMHGGVVTVSDNVRDMQQSASLSSGEARNVRDSARMLAEQAERMRTEINAFLGSIRVAA